MRKQFAPGHWRRTNLYICKKCNKKRRAFNYERAERRVCTICEKQKVVNENQPRLL